MSWSSILGSTLASSEAPPSDTLARAKELMDLITSPTSIATLVLLAFARGQLDRNATSAVDRGRTAFALAAALGAVVITVVIVIVMVPLSYRMLFTNRGGVETTLLVYGLTQLVAVGTAVYAGKIAYDCLSELLSADADRR